jgi:hypothetical protein
MDDDLARDARESLIITVCLRKRTRPVSLVERVWATDSTVQARHRPEYSNLSSTYINYRLPETALIFQNELLFAFSREVSTPGRPVSSSHFRALPPSNSIVVIPLCPQWFL